MTVNVNEKVVDIALPWTLQWTHAVGAKFSYQVIDTNGRKVCQISNIYRGELAVLIALMAIPFVGGDLPHPELMKMAREMVNGLLTKMDADKDVTP